MAITIHSVSISAEASHALSAWLYQLDCAIIEEAKRHAVSNKSMRIDLQTIETVFAPACQAWLQSFGQSPATEANHHTTAKNQAA